MILRIFVSILLLCLLSTALHAQGTPGGKTPILTGFFPMQEQDLKDGFIRLEDGISDYGWLWKTDPPTEVNIRGFEGLKLPSRKPAELVESPADFFGGEVPILSDRADNIFQTDVKTPIFDGKTLAGWTLRGKAEAAVQDGVIRLTNGSGSLESDGKYGDFVLQLEYWTPVREDKGVNSGVFFRCIPGEMMNGYECQILNNAGESDYKNFIGTDTGGIFRRQVGRNVGPKDGVWNYLTIAAKGNRFATWVNGIQTANWTDDRKPHNNPRNGCRTEAGTIQFQGHDPSTEILFRNIRIRTF